MTLNEIIKIQSVIDNRSIASDTLKSLKKVKYYSESKKKFLSIGDMHIDHYVRSTNKKFNEISKINFELALELIDLRNKVKGLNE
jgi:hypothetical protein|tara:strand:- start:16 stop:270 length:255 start_codon:yes stop_codon:yes gene_type:complete